MSNQKAKPLSETSPAWKIAKPFVFGAASTCFATFCIQPIDLVKVRIQVQGEGTGQAVIKNPFTMASQILKSEGPLAFYKGLSAAILRQLTYGTTRMGVFETLNNWRKEQKGGKLDTFDRLGLSLFAGGIGALIGTPADAALVRMQTDSLLPAAERRGYKNAIDALVRMAREEGLRGFFSGASPTIGRALAVNVGQFTTYDASKEFFQPYLGNGTATIVVSSFISGWSAATLSLPFDFVKTRLQKQKAGPDGKVPYNGLLDCFRKVAAREGVGAFYNGYVTYVFRISPHIMLTWFGTEVLRSIVSLQ